MPSPTSDRLDKILVQKGLVETRSRARDLIKRGKVQVNGAVADKPATTVSGDADISLLGNDGDYVSRGSLKLIGALDHFGFSVEGGTALDLGASTGGFTQVLLERGARKVYAVDVGRDQLHQKVRDDARVVCLEGQDSRMLTTDIIDLPINVFVSDLSFISLKQALLPALTFAADGAVLAVLVKPQFEVGRDAVGKGGIVRDEAVRLQAVEDVSVWLEQQPGWRVIGTTPSPITGQGGNQEYLLGAIYHG